MQLNSFFFDNKKMARTRDDECCGFRIMHEIKLQSLFRVRHVYKTVWNPYKGEKLIVQPDSLDEAQKMINMLLEFTRKMMVDQKNWLTMRRLYQFLYASAENCIKVEVIGNRKS